MSKEKIYFKNLDTIRFIAAIMVFNGHTILNSFEKLHIENRFINRFIELISDGGKGVSIFFVLSGFLITYLLISEVESKGSLNLKHFYLRRFLRIWPLYYLVVFFTFIIYPSLKSLIGMNTELDSNIIYYLFFLSNFDVINVFQDSSGLNAFSQSITWSVSVEEQFYLFWPLIFLLPKKKWLTIFIILFIFSAFFRITYSESYYINYYHTFAVLIDLLTGAFFAYAVKYNNKIKLIFEKSNTVSHLLLFLITFLTMYFGTEKILGSYENSLGRLITSFLFGLIIVSQSLTKKQSILNLGNFSFASKWGKLTYGIYLLHPIVITLTDVLCRVFKINYKINFYSEFGMSMIMMFLTFLLSKLSYQYYEVKFLKLKEKYK